MIKKSKRVVSIILIVLFITLILPLSPNVSAMAIPVSIPNISMPSSVNANQSITANWNSISGATGYTIALLNQTSGVKIINDLAITQASYTISANMLTPGNSYKFWVGASDSTGTNAGSAAYFTVAAAQKQLTSLVSSPSRLTVEKGKSISFVSNVKITGYYSDGTSEDLTYQAGNNASMSNSSIASVGGGYVTGLNAGTTTLTCSYNVKSVSIGITVTNSQLNIEVKSISVDKTSMTIKEGESQLLAASVLPVNATNKTITWMSGNSSIASVDSNGKVTGVKEGRTVISAITLDGRKTASCTVTVQTKANTSVTDYTVNSEVRYLPNTDDVYLMAQINPTIGQKNDKEWPIVWAGVYDLDNNEWLYKVPDQNNIMTHVRFNTYEMYFPSAKLRRLTNLKFVFFVDGYQSYENITTIKGKEIIITPAPKQSWKVSYNWRTDELEAFTNPIIDRQKNFQSIPEFYTVIYDNNNKPLYENIDKNNIVHYYGENGPVAKYNGKYFRSWKYNQLLNRNSKQDVSFKVGVRTARFEDQFSKELLDTITIYKPQITSLDLKFNQLSKKVSVSVNTKGIPGSYQLELLNDKGQLIEKLNLRYSSDYSPLGYSNKELSLDLNKSYNLFVLVKDIYGREVLRSGVKSVSTQLPKTPPTITSYDPWSDYGVNNMYFDSKNNYDFAHSDFSLACEGKFSFAGFAIEVPNLPKEGAKDLWQYSYNYVTRNYTPMNEIYRRDNIRIQKQLIKNMVESMNDPNMADKVMKEAVEYEKLLGKYLSLDENILENITDSTSLANLLKSQAIRKIPFDLETATKIDNLSKNLHLKTVDNLLKKTHVSKMDILDFILVAASTENLSNKAIYSFKTVADTLGKQNDDVFYDAVYELVDEYNKKNSAKWGELEAKFNELIADKAVEGTLMIAGKCVTGIVGVGFIAFDLIFEGQRTTLNSTLSDYFIMGMAGSAYKNIRTNRINDLRNKNSTASDLIRDCGVVYLLAAKDANTNYSEFNKVLSRNRKILAGGNLALIILDSDIKNFEANSLRCEARADKISKALINWIRFGVLSDK